MDYITTTDLRTKSSNLVDALALGVKVTLIHRSKIIGYIQPTTKKQLVIKAERLSAFLNEIKPQKILSKENRKSIYMKYLKQHHGKDLS